MKCSNEPCGECDRHNSVRCPEYVPVEYSGGCCKNVFCIVLSCIGAYVIGHIVGNLLGMVICKVG